MWAEGTSSDTNSLIPLHHRPVLITCSRREQDNLQAPPKQMTAVNCTMLQTMISQYLAILICTCATDVIQVGGGETD